jgi:hypothetical protein
LNPGVSVYAFLSPPGSSVILLIFIFFKSPLHLFCNLFPTFAVSLPVSANQIGAAILFSFSQDQAMVMDLWAIDAANPINGRYHYSIGSSEGDGR